MKLIECLAYFMRAKECIKGSAKGQITPLNFYRIYIRKDLFEKCVKENTIYNN